MSSTTAMAREEIQGDLLKLSQLVDPAEIIHDTSEDYALNSTTWSAAKNKHPRLVLRPRTIESLAGTVKFLAATDLDCKVRSRGYGSSSAADVLISLTAFDDFEYNEENQYVILGTGNNWRSYYERMEKVSTDHTVVCIRSPSIGVGGSSLCSGFSWLSGEYGCSSDASNLLDIQVVTATGEIKWASSDPELFWAMRGTEGGFAIATHFKFRAHYFPQNGRIWGGPIMIPQDKVPEVSKGIYSMVQQDKRGELSLQTGIFVYVLRKEMLSFINVTQDVLVVHAFDARGEAAGREAFRWALKIEGAIDQTRSDMTLADISRMQDGADALLGRSSMYWSPIALTTEGEDQLTEDVIRKSFEWWQEMQKESNSIAQIGTLMFELFSCRDNLSGRATSAWPRPVGYKHMILLGTGCSPDSNDEIKEKARRYMTDAPEKIFGKSMHDIDTVPNAIEDFHNVERIYGEHYEKLRQVKTRVDPRNRLQGWIKPL